MSDSYSLITSLVTGFGLALPFGYFFERFLKTPALVGYIFAGLAVGFWSGPEELAKKHAIDKMFVPDISEEERRKRLRGWHKAVRCAYNWARDDEDE